MQQTLCLWLSKEIIKKHSKNIFLMLKKTFSYLSHARSYISSSLLKSLSDLNKSLCWPTVWFLITGTPIHL